jgi:ankyrin repeat protein
MKVYFTISFLSLFSMILLTLSFNVSAQINKNDAFLKAVEDDDLVKAKVLLKTGANVNAKGKYFGRRALFDAVRSGNKEMLQLLLDAGADVNARDNEGNTAIMNTYTQATAEIVRMLTNRGADVNAKDKDGNTALISMAVFDNYEVLQAFIDAGADVNAANKEGVTALMRSAKDRQLKNVKLLLTADADINLKDKDGWTALTYAQKNNDAKIVLAIETFRKFGESALNKEQRITQLNAIKRCTDTSDKSYERAKVLEQFAQIINDSIRQNRSYQRRNYYVNGDEQVVGFFVDDLTDSSNKESFSQCVNLINNHIYHFAPYYITHSFSNIAILEDGKLKIFKAINCDNSKDSIDEVLSYLNQKSVNEKNIDEIISRVRNYRKDQPYHRVDPMASLRCQDLEIDTN